MTRDPIAVRPARAADRAFIVTTAGRLGEFGPPAWRTPEEIVAGEVRTLEAHFGTPDERNALLVAESAKGELFGFVFLESPVDYFTGRRHGHIGILAVAREADGKGAGRALLAAADDWARSRGYELLTLNVFAANRHARDVYEHLGYAPETVRYVKRLA